jgi:hypothetical protein
MDTQMTDIYRRGSTDGSYIYIYIYIYIYNQGKRNYQIEHIANGVTWEGLEKGDMKGQEGEREGRNYVVIF